MFDVNELKKREKIFDAIPLRNCLRNLQLEMMSIFEKKDFAEEKISEFLKRYIDDIEIALDTDKKNNEDS
jgi:hypothetical protein